MMFKRYLTLVLILVFLFCSVLYAQEQSNQESDQQINDFSLVGYGEKGKKTWDLTAKSADIFPHTVKLNDLVGNLYGEKEDIKLTSDRGDFDKVAGNVHLEQNVVITTSSGARLTTNSLDWNRENEIITTQDLVNIEKENLFTTAFGATGQPDLNKVILEKDVTVKINPVTENQSEQEVVKKDKIVITCDGPLQIDYEKNIATFNDNVKVDTEDVEIYGDIMYVYFLMSDKDEAESDEAPRVMGTQIKKIITQGNVKIVRGDNLCYSDEAIYTALDKKITLLGRPKLIIYSTEDIGGGL